MFGKKNLVIIITSGKADGGLRAALGYAFAINALAFNTEVEIFLTGAGAIWGTTEIENEKDWGFPPIKDMIAQLHEHGAKEYLCIVCYKSCVTGEVSYRSNVEIVGMSTILPRVIAGNAIVF